MCQSSEQHFVATSLCFDWVVTGGIFTANPALMAGATSLFGRCLAKDHDAVESIHKPPAAAGLDNPTRPVHEPVNGRPDSQIFGSRGDGRFIHTPSRHILLAAKVRNRNGLHVCF